MSDAYHGISGLLMVGVHLIGVIKIKNQMEMLFQSSQSCLQMWSHPQNRFSWKKKTHTNTECEQWFVSLITCR